MNDKVVGLEPVARIVIDYSGLYLLKGDPENLHHDDPLYSEAQVAALQEEVVKANKTAVAMSQLHDTAEEEIAALQAELAACQKDAERYRWLRNSHNQGANAPDGQGILVVTDRPSKEPRYIGPLAWQLLDAAVDAAMKEGSDGNRH